MVLELADSLLSRKGAGLGAGWAATFRESVSHLITSSGTVKGSKELKTYTDTQGARKRVYNRTFFFLVLIPHPCL